MHDDAVECLVYAADESEAAEALVPLLEEQGVRVARPAEPRECLDLLAARSWHFLIVHVDGDAKGPLEMISQARQTCPDVPSFVLVKRGDVEMAVRAMKAGAANCIETPIDAARLLSIIVGLRGQRNRESRSVRASLTRVEQIVLWHVLEGRTNRQIANALSRSPRTVEVHRRHVMRKLGAGTLLELVKRAMQTGIVDCLGGPAGEAPGAMVSPRRRKKWPSAVASKAD